MSNENKSSAGTLGNIHVKHVGKQFQIDGKNVDILQDINLEIPSGQFVSIIGASGCGKSTLLRMIAGLEPTEEGSIDIDDKPVTGPGLTCGMAFQEARLFPWLSVKKNIAYGLSKDVPKEEAEREISYQINLVGLNGFENAYPSQLSGGMQQRASIARALIGKPHVLLLDEPFGALDAFTRMNMQNELLKIWSQEKCTTILVTHDIDEAIFLSDRIVILSKRPAGIKEVVDVELGRPRDRSSVDFLELRRRILTTFLGHTDPNIEYYI